MFVTLFMVSHIQTVSHKYYNLNVNKDFAMFLTSKLITCFTDGFTFEMKSQSIANLLTGSAHIYWILDLKVEMHSILGFVDKQPSILQGQSFL